MFGQDQQLSQLTGITLHRLHSLPARRNPTSSPKVKLLPLNPCSVSTLCDLCQYTLLTEDDANSLDVKNDPLKMSRPALYIGPEMLIASAPPQLPLGPYHTQHSALHDLEFTGVLQPWQGFLSSVQTAHQNYTFRSQTLALTLKTRDPYAQGNVEIGDEHGLLGRFHKHFGDVLNSVFTSHSTGIRFADFKCVQSTFSGTPDVILKDDNHHVKVAGELKVPWIADHWLEDKYNDVDQLRIILAQPIKYMQRLGCVYGFMSNYEETIFLRQLVDSQGAWRIEYSPVVRSSDTYDRHRTNSHAVSARQCFFYVGCDALNHGVVNNTTPRWVMPR